MRIFMKTGLTVLGLLASSMTANAAHPTNLIVNGDFETGDFSGWNIVNTGSGGTVINDGSYVPLGPGGALPPISGRYDGLTWQPGPGFHAFTQKITIPNNVFTATLTWNDRVRNYAAIYSNPNQQWRAVIRDTSGVLLATLFQTETGDPLLQVGPNARSAALTGFFQNHPGQTVIISFEEQDNLSFFNATLDDVKLLASFLPTAKDECKEGSWQTFVNVETGQQVFKNQGDCVSYIATKGKNLPAGAGYQ